MPNTINIAKASVANALTSSDKNHIIAVANDVYDESLNKYQKDINEDHESRLVSLESGDSIDMEDYITKDELDEKGYLTSIPEDYITDSELEIALKNFEDNLENLGITDLTVDAEKGWLRATGQTDDGVTKNYFIALTELIKPAAPIIDKTTYSVVTGSITVSITNKESGSSVYYSTNDGTTWVNGTSVSLASNFSNNSDNTPQTKNIWVKSIKNGEESDINKYIITINPKVSTPGLSVTRNNNNNNWSTSAVIKFTPSSTIGATNYYSMDSGKTWEAFTAEFTETVTESKSANVYQVKSIKDNYIDSDIAKNANITLNAKKAYYGFSILETLTSESEIKSLIGGGEVEGNALLGQYSIEHTEDMKESSNKKIFPYIWLCCVNTINYNGIVPKAGDTIPMGFNNYITVNGWKCYRGTNGIDANSGDETYVYIPT